MRLWGVLVGLLWVAVPTMANPWQPFTSLVASSDGQFFATGGMGGEVLWWELSTGEVLGKWQVSSHPIAGIAFGPRGEGLVAVALNGEGFFFPGPDQGPRILDPRDPLMGLLAAVQRWLTEGPPMAGVQASQADSMARGLPDGTILVTSALVPPLRWQAHWGAVTGLVWTGVGHRLLSCSYDGSLALWDGQTGKLLSRL